MEEIRQILAGLDWSPLFISIKTGIAATIVSFFLGIWAARKVLCKKDHETETGSKGSAGWDSDTAADASADGCRIFPAAHFQYEKNRWIVSLYDI